MKYLLICLTFLACSSKHASTPATTTTATTPAVETAANQGSAQDSIVPPAYDKAGKLITLERSNEEWKKMLTKEQYYVMREAGTERAFTGALWNNHEKGTFICAACGLPAYSSETKFESGTGWPSFYQPIAEDRVRSADDHSYGMVRSEVRCARCGAHQGHVFDDGPKPTGLRYCINSAALSFVKE